jgi:signal transduction histidine kinase
MKIRTKIILLFLPGSLFLIVIIGLLFYNISVNNMTLVISNHLVTAAEYKADSINSYFSERKKDLNMLTNSSFIIDNLQKLNKVYTASGLDHASFIKTNEYNETIKELDLCMHNYKDQYGYKNIFIIDYDGNILYRAMDEPGFGTNILDGSIKETSLGKTISLASESGKIVFSDYEYYPFDDIPKAFLSGIIYNHKGDIHAFISLELPVDKINEIMQTPIGLGETGETYLVGEDYLMRSDSKFFNESTILKQKVNTENVRDCFLNKTASGTIREELDTSIKVFRDYRDIRVLGTNIYLPELNWALLAEIDMLEALAPIDIIRNTMLFFGIVLLLFIVFISLIIARVISNPIQTLEKGSIMIGKGDFNHKIVVKTRDEIGELAASFNQMAGNLEKSYKERKKLIKELEAKNTELERYTYTVAHDLKSPIITIKGFLALVRKDLESRDEKQIFDDLTRIDNAADKMQVLLEELLELSRIGRLINPPQKLLLADIVREVIELLTRKISDKGIKIEISPGLPQVYGDYPRILEVIQNLIQNAIKFMGGQPEPHIRIGSRTDGNLAVFFVQDNGIGIKREYHERIFGIFDKLDPGIEGTGIGLTICRRIIEIHGGKIWVESEGMSKGSTFCFTLQKKRRF